MGEHSVEKNSLAVLRALEQGVWFPEVARDASFSRTHDDSEGDQTQTLDVGIGPDGDVWVKTQTKGPFETLRFRTSGGGGLSRHTYYALIILARAIALDNEKKPIAAGPVKLEPFTSDVVTLVQGVYASEQNGQEVPFSLMLRADPQGDPWDLVGELTDSNGTSPVLKASLLENEWLSFDLERDGTSIHFLFEKKGNVWVGTRDDRTCRTPARCAINAASVASLSLTNTLPGA